MTQEDESRFYGRVFWLTAAALLALALLSILKPFFFGARIEGTKGHFARGGFRGGVGLPGDHLGLSPTARLRGRSWFSAAFASRRALE